MEEYNGEWPVLDFVSQAGADKPRGAKPLVLNEIMDNQIYTIDNFLDKRLCKEFIEIIEKEIAADPENSQLKPINRPGYAFRNNSRVAFNSTAMASALWIQTGLASLVKQKVKIKGLVPIGLHENIRLYKYSHGQKFGKHYDDHLFNYQGKRSEYTLLVYLNDISEYPMSPPIGNDSTSNGKNSVSKKRDKVMLNNKKIKKDAGGTNTDTFNGDHGGETIFYNPNPFYRINVKPTSGKLLLHKHGSDCLIHEGGTVIRGVKYVLRSDILFQPL
ncbi:hypothetical protein AYI68_g1944 [Smittium mucronatum]|uniref:Prolyl 4-hydroxylase alpha subunit domain-containing protein n=1 Tax=Smittium mucronatum TaxID=133383 RepID=A0A1R0H445_9FUNG|nr:hypothetical protein AYI68_g1944 [Smittium mucronatum]